MLCRAVALSKPDLSAQKCIFSLNCCFLWCENEKLCIRLNTNIKPKHMATFDQSLRWHTNVYEGSQQDIVLGHKHWSRKHRFHYLQKNMHISKNMSIYSCWTYTVAYLERSFSLNLNFSKNLEKTFQIWPQNIKI